MMKLSGSRLSARHLSVGVASAAALGLVVALPFSAQAAEPLVPLGAATSFAVLAGTQVTNTGSSVISGDVGANAGFTGFPPALVTNGTTHNADPATAAAHVSLTAAYGNAFLRVPATSILPELGGQTLKTGVYTGGALVLNGNLTLDAEGVPDAVFIIKSTSALDTASGSRVNLINGASSCNVFWQVSSTATLGAGSTFRGTMMAQTSAVLLAGATVDGRVLAQTAEVTLITNTISTSCVVGGTTVPPTATPSPSITPGGSQTGTGTSATARRQVTRVPAGAVSTGDGSTDGGAGAAQTLLAGVVVFAGAAGTTLVAARRRRHKA